MGKRDLRGARKQDSEKERAVYLRSWDERWSWVQLERALRCCCCVRGGRERHPFIRSPAASRHRGANHSGLAVCTSARTRPSFILVQHGPGTCLSQPTRTHTDPPQKAVKTLAAANTKRLNTTLALTLGIHLAFWLLRALVFRASFTRKSLLLYLALASPQLFINFLFEKQSRPLNAPDGSVKRAGEDLEAKGLTEYLWDVTYWTYGVLVLVTFLGDWAWIFWAIIPVYSLWLAWSTYSGMRSGYQDAAGVPQPGVATSKRQAKMEKRGGQKVQYR